MDKENRIFFSGDSMQPTLATSDRVTVEPAGYSDIKIGDIVVFDKEKLICHRVLGKYKARGRYYFLEKGDNQKHKDINNVPFEKLIGRVVRAETFKGKVFYPKKIFSKASVARLRVLSLIFGLLHSLKLLLLGERRNPFTRNLRYLISRLFA